MPTIVTLPRNAELLAELGAYRSTLSLGRGTTSTQRKYRDGLHGFEPGTQSTLLTLVQLATPRPVHFFDIGAHVGMHALIVGSVFPARRARVTAFEPTPRTAAVCRALAGANNLDLRVEPCAVSDEDGTATLYISPWETSNSLAEGFRPAQEVVGVPAVTLDTYCARRGVLPSVLKIDVESYEAHVVRGALRVLDEARPSVVCEILPDTAPADVEQSVAPFAALGYHLHRWTRADGWTECSAADVVARVPHDGNDWLFTPTPLGERFRTALTAWRAAVARCRANRVVHLPNGARYRPSQYALRPDERLRVLSRAGRNSRAG